MNRLGPECLAQFKEVRSVLGTGQAVRASCGECGIGFEVPIRTSVGRSGIVALVQEAKKAAESQVRPDCRILHPLLTLEERRLNDRGHYA